MLHGDRGGEVERNWYYAARIVWDILIANARQRTTITYGEIAPTIETNPLNVGKALGPIQDFCMASGFPPLTALVINTRGIPGPGFIAWDVDDVETAQRMVFDFNWANVPNPYGAFGPDDTVGSFAHKIVEDPDAAAEVFIKVRARGVAQLVFRRSLLEAYECRCSFCGLSFESALEAAHIVAWNDCTQAQRIDPRNGLLLCANHHRLFDRGAITISRSFKVVYYDTKMKDGPYSATDRALSVALHGCAILLPKSKKIWPSSAYIVHRHEVQGWDELPEHITRMLS